MRLASRVLLYLLTVAVWCVLAQRIPTAWRFLASAAFGALAFGVFLLRPLLEWADDV